MKIFMFSEVECFGTAFSSATGEGDKYPIFTDNASRIKNASNWRTRSPVISNNSSFCNVHDDGSARMNSADSVRGVCFGFSI